MFTELKFWWRRTILECNCKYRPRREWESKRDWIKDMSCMYHWMLSKYYKAKFDRRMNGPVH
jgi:hypothetical protein